jgi:hypothetical protein
MRPHAAVVRRILTLTMALLVGVVMAVVGSATPALAEDDEGSEALLVKLEQTSKAYLDAKTKLDASKARQQQLATELAGIETNLGGQLERLQEMAAAAYRSGGLTATVSFLDSGSPDNFVDRVTMLDVVAGNQEEVVQEVVHTRDKARDAKALLDAEVVQEQGHVAAMAAQKQKAEAALRAAGGGAATSGFGGSSAVAQPAPRNRDGSWPPERCSIEDPTPATGCITPRTLHALNQAKAAGFKRYVTCHRNGGNGEHPKGRACDFAAQTNGFGGLATGGDRTYGNNLATFFINNSSRLAVLYVIWFRQIWLPGSGWRSYSGRGSPSAEHTNHVHLSVY